MKTIIDVKQDLIDYLLSIDKASLSMADLKVYCEVVTVADTMFKPGPFDYFPTLMNGFNAMGQDKTVKLKEE